jgi:hypothetical protein
MPSVGFNQHDTAFSYVVFERLSRTGTKSTGMRRTKLLTALPAGVAQIAA